MAPLLDIGDTIDSYVIDDVLAAGSTTTTYRATHRQLGRTVALKVFHGEVFAAEPDARERARRDAIQSAQLEHPSIATVYTAGPVGDGMYVASALVSGVTLTEAVRAKDITPAKSAEVISTIAGALETAHAAGIVHRELRPEAITLDRRGHAMLRDFGVTRLSGRTGLATRMEFAETLRYSAPELILGRAATGSADVYGLAATAFFCLTGQHPFPDLPVGELVAVRTTAQPPRITAADGLDRLLQRAMAIEPSERPASPAAFAAEFAEAVGALPVAISQEPSPLHTATPEPPASALPPLETQPPAPAGATRVDRQRALPPVNPEPVHERHWGTLAAIAGALAACAVVGFALGQVTAPGPPALPRSGSFAIVTRGVWSPGDTPVTAVAVGHPISLKRDDALATVGTLDHARFPGDPVPVDNFKGDAPVGKPSAVRAGSRTLVRYTAGDAVVFALPTTKATVVAACAPAASADRCAALLAAAKLPSGVRLVAPQPSPGATKGVGDVLRKLEVARGRADAELSGAATGRAAAASQLGGAYRSAAGDLKSIVDPAGSVLQQPLLDGAAAFDDLSSAIDQASGPGFADARRRAVAADAALAESLRRLRRAGYRVTP